MYKPVPKHYIRVWPFTGQGLGLFDDKGTI